MSSFIQFLTDHAVLLVFGIILFFSATEVIGGYYSKSKRSKDDLLIESINTFVLLLITKPVILFVAMWLMSVLFPTGRNILVGYPFILQFALFVLVEDFMQYWYHRSAHEYKWLWKLHRAHHAAEEMGLLVSYRQSVWYYFLMPNIYWLGIYTYLGGGVSVALGLVLKQIIVISSHSLVTWDSFFHKRPGLMPVMRVLERIFITPSFHHAHHAPSKIDGIGNPDGNFGNMFSIWDQIFGTGIFTHQFPKAYGLEVNWKEGWAANTFWPIVKSANPQSELSRDYVLEDTTKGEPAALVLKAGDYLYCQCGFSKTQPFCDGSHHGTKYQPLKFSVQKERTYKLCQCKLCEKGPFCDNSHITKLQKL